MEWEPQGSRFPLKTRRSSLKIRAENTAPPQQMGVPGDWSVSILAGYRADPQALGTASCLPLHRFPEARTTRPTRGSGSRPISGVRMLDTDDVCCRVDAGEEVGKDASLTLNILIRKMGTGKPPFQG